MIATDRIKAFLDDLALISAKHGVRLECASDADVFIESGDVQGYVYNTHYCRLHCWLEPNRTDDEIVSLDVSTITAHQHITLAKSLRDAASLPAGPDIPNNSKGEDQ